MARLIEVNNLSYTYRSGSANKVQALNRITMEVHRGEILAITGQNGSGKSTLARHFNSLLIPTSGEVLVDGLSAADKKNIAAIRKMIGMVFQNPDNQLISSLVEEDIAFGPENLGLPAPEIKKRVDWALESLNITALRQASPNNLSEGQKQLVAIAGVLAMKPECIVLDEPTTHLDPRGRREVLDNILRLNREDGITIVLVTHFMQEVAHCDRMIIMEQGKIKMSGTPRELFRYPEKIRSFGLDSPVASKIADGLRKRGFDLPDDILLSEELADSLCQLL